MPRISPAFSPPGPRAGPAAGGFGRKAFPGSQRPGMLYASTGWRAARQWPSAASRLTQPAWAASFFVVAGVPGAAASTLPRALGGR